MRPLEIINARARSITRRNFHGLYSTASSSRGFLFVRLLFFYSTSRSCRAVVNLPDATYLSGYIQLGVITANLHIPWVGRGFYESSFVMRNINNKQSNFAALIARFLRNFASRSFRRTSFNSKKRNHKLSSLTSIFIFSESSRTA